jgi:hypothetical protein
VRTSRPRTAALVIGTALAAVGCAAEATGGGATPTAAPTSSPTSQEPVDDGSTGYASAFLGAGGASGSDDVFAHVTVWAPSGQDAFANGEFFVLGYDCLTEQTVPATVAGIDSATARGELALTCGSHQADGAVTGTAVIDLVWTAEGPVRAHSVSNSAGTCTEEISDRHAVVAGTVHLVVPALGYDGVAVSLGDDDDSVSRGLSDCT